MTHEVNPVLPYVDRMLYLVGGRFAVGSPAEILTSERLSALYGTQVDVVRARRPGRRGDADDDDATGGGDGHHAPAVSAPPSGRTSRLHPVSRLPFAQHALAAAALVAISCGLIGPFVITRGMAFAVHGTSELAFTGAVAGLLVADNAIAGALVGALVVAA